MNSSRFFSRLGVRERGFSTFSAMFWLLVLVGCGYLFFKILPVVNEHFTVRKAIRGVAAAGLSTPLEIQDSFDRQRTIEGIVSLSGRDLEITREEGVFVISYAYERKVPLTSDISLLIRYQGSTRKGGI